MENICEFFHRIQDLDDSYALTVVSSGSDYGVTYQETEPVWKDMNKWFNFISSEPKQGYSGMYVHTRCQPEFCKITDKYSVKVYSFTIGTFNEIPSCIRRWYATNINLNNNDLYDFTNREKIIRIPFGISEDTKKLILQVKNIDWTQRDKYVILSHQCNTLARKEIYSIEHPSLIKYDGHLSHDEYIYKLSTTCGTISLSGNGYDCYRNLEAYYCGNTPIILNNNAMSVYSNTGAKFWNNIDEYHQCIDNTIYQNNLEYDEKMYFDYWQKEIS